METSTSRGPARSADFLAVQASDGSWLAPCPPARARQLLRTGKARLAWRGTVAHLKLLTDADAPGAAQSPSAPRGVPA
jgi:hypothetical protein